MANWRLSKTTLNHIEWFPRDRDMCKITSSHLAQLPDNIWMKIFYYCGKTYFKPWIRRASDTYRSIDLITWYFQQLRLITEPELVPPHVHQLRERLTDVRVKEMHQSMGIDELEKHREHEEQIAPVFKKIEPIMVFPIG